MSRFTCFEDACGCAQVFQKFKGGGEMSVSIEAIIENPCLLQPPALPPENSNFNLPKLEAHRNKYDAWYTYVAECTNGTFSSKTAASSTTSVTIERTTSQGGVITPLASSTEFVTDKITTKSLSTPVPVIPRTSQTAAGESSLLVILIPVVIVALVALVLAVLIYKFKSKIRKPCRSTGNGQPPSYTNQGYSEAQIGGPMVDKVEYTKKTSSDSTVGLDPVCTDDIKSSGHVTSENQIHVIVDEKKHAPSEHTDSFSKAKAHYLKNGSLSSTPLLDEGCDNVLDGINNNAVVGDTSEEGGDTPEVDGEVDNSNISGPGNVGSPEVNDQQEESQTNPAQNTNTSPVTETQPDDMESDTSELKS